MMCRCWVGRSFRVRFGRDESVQEGPICEDRVLLNDFGKGPSWALGSRMGGTASSLAHLGEFKGERRSGFVVADEVRRRAEM
jgi:hypothetical protein